MPRVISNYSLTIQVGTTTLGPFNPTKDLFSASVVYDCAAWPEVKAGELVVTVQRSKDNWATYADVWSDRFPYVKQMRRGVAQSTGMFSISLPEPFTAASRMRIVFVSDVEIATTVSVSID